MILRLQERRGRCLIRGVGLLQSQLTRTVYGPPPNWTFGFPLRWCKPPGCGAMHVCRHTWCHVAGARQASRLRPAFLAVPGYCSHLAGRGHECPQDTHVFGRHCACVKRVPPDAYGSHGAAHGALLTWVWACKGCAVVPLVRFELSYRSAWPPSHGLATPYPMMAHHLPVACGTLSLRQLAQVTLLVAFGSRVA